MRMHRLAGRGGHGAGASELRGPSADAVPTPRMIVGQGNARRRTGPKRQPHSQRRFRGTNETGALHALQIQFFAPRSSSASSGTTCDRVANTESGKNATSATATHLGQRLGRRANYFSFAPPGRQPQQQEVAGRGNADAPRRPPSRRHNHSRAYHLALSWLERLGTRESRNLFQLGFSFSPREPN